MGGDKTLSLPEAERSKEPGRMVIDRSGVLGRDEVALRGSPEGGASAPPSFSSALPNSALPTAADSGPSLFTALPEQLGLRLESGNGPDQVAAIDTIETPEMPSANRRMRGW